MVCIIFHRAVLHSSLASGDFCHRNSMDPEQDPMFMGKFFQNYSFIQDFEADFPQKVSLKILN